MMMLADIYIIMQ